MSGALVALLLAALPAPAWAQTHTVTVHSSASAATDNDGDTSLSIPFTMPTNGTGPGTYVCKHPALVVAVSILLDSGQAPSVSSVVWDPDPSGAPTYALEQQGTTIGTSDSSGDNSRKRTEMWLITTELPNAVNPLPSGSGNVIVTLSNQAEMVAGVVMTCGVRQDAPRRGGAAADPGSLEDDAPSLSVLSVNQGLAIDVLAVEGNITVTAANPGRTNRWNLTTGGTANDLRGYASTYPTTATNTTLEYTLSGNDHWVMSALGLRPAALTAVEVSDFAVTRGERGALLSWFAGYDAGNLGFRLWRERGGVRSQVTPELVAGSFLSHGATPLAAGHPYAWEDPAGRPGDVYELEAVELSGASAVVARGRLDGRAARRMLRGSSPTLSQTAAAVGSVARVRPYVPSRGAPSGPTSEAVQFWLAGQPAVKMGVKESGWYRVSLAELAATGLRFTTADVPRLRLFADGREVAAKVHLAGSGSVLDRDSFVEFWGEALESPYSDTRVYWLVVGETAGARIVEPASGVGAAQAKPVTYLATEQIRERLVYVPVVRNGTGENFFGRAVTATPVTFTLATPHATEGKGNLTVRLQGLTAGQHAVEVALNGVALGVVNGAGEGLMEATFELAGALLRPEADNEIVLSSRSGADVVSVVDTLTLAYPRLSRAARDELFMPRGTFPATGQILLGGFSESGVRAFDVTDPFRPVELAAAPVVDGAGWGVVVEVGRGILARPKAIYAAAPSRNLSPAWLRLNRPSQLHAASNGAGVIYVTRDDMTSALAALVAARKEQGLAPMVVEIEDVYDEFSFGSPTPAALRAFFQRTTTVWARAPQYVALAGDGSYDPRGYLGKAPDVIPVALVDTSVFETASDEWFVDFDGDGVGDLAIGRLPAASAAEMATMVEKILRYERGSRSSKRALLVADDPLAEAFSVVNDGLAELLPAGTAIERIDVETEGAAGARTHLLDELVRGANLIHYSGHGTVDRWRHGLLSAADAPTLPVTEQVPFYTMANCLSGIFQEPLLAGLGEELMRAPGGAAAVWASTGSTGAPPQERLLTEFFSQIGGASPVRAGDAVRAAKNVISDQDVRLTWVLLGDPAMPLW